MMASAVAIISAEAKRGVNLANLIGVRVRNHLIVDDISDLMTILLLGKKQIGMQLFWSNHGSTATIVRLQIQEFGKTAQRLSVRINRLYGIYNKKYCIFFYLEVVYYMYLLSFPFPHRQLLHIYHR